MYACINYLNKSSIATRAIARVRAKFDERVRSGIEKTEPSIKATQFDVLKIDIALRLASRKIGISKSILEKVVLLS